MMAVCLDGTSGRSWPARPARWTQPTCLATLSGMVMAGVQVDRVLAHMQQATQANRATTSRRGNIIHLDKSNADEVMIAADIHGNRLNYDKLLKVADLQGHPRRHLVMQEVCHGGPSYPEGGCMSHLLLEDVAGLKTEFPDRLHFLLSNHELAEVTEFPIMKSNRMLNLSFRLGMQQMYGSRVDEVRDAYRDFILSCPLGVRAGDDIFVSHSMPENVDELGFDADVFERPLGPKDFEPRGTIFRLVWGRDFRAANASAFCGLLAAKLLIQGHEPCPDGFQVPNERQVILDCCCEQASYVVLPIGEPLSREKVVSLIRRL